METQRLFQLVGVETSRHSCQGDNSCECEVWHSCITVVFHLCLLLPLPCACQSFLPAVTDITIQLPPLPPPSPPPHPASPRIHTWRQPLACFPFSKIIVKVMAPPHVMSGGKYLTVTTPPPPFTTSQHVWGCSVSTGQSRCAHRATQVNWRREVTFELCVPFHHFS